jgi:predicted DNA-binding transcriptional regulator YafY
MGYRVILNLLFFMTTLDILKVAIKNQQQISFEYIKEGEDSGVRYGNPHAVYLHKTTDNPIVDIYQTSGASSTKQKIPGWRPFILDNIQNIHLLDTKFEIAEDYVSNPKTGRYDKIIAKVQ